MLKKLSELFKQTLRFVLYGVVSIFILMPFLWALASSFKPLNAIFRHVAPFSWRTFLPTPFTIEPYVILFTETGYLRALLNSVFVALVVVMVGVLINSLSGFAFAKLRFPGKNLIFGVVLVSFMVPFEAISIPLYNVVNGLGWVNTYKALIIPAVANGLTIFMFRQFFAGVPDALLDAARIDGASTFRTYLTIFLPLSKPAIISASLILFVSQWDAFLWPLVAANRPNLRLIQVALSYINTEYTTFWNQIFAGSVIAALIPLILIYPLQRYYIEGISGSGIKG